MSPIGGDIKQTKKKKAIVQSTAQDLTLQVTIFAMHQPNLAVLKLAFCLLNIFFTDPTPLASYVIFGTYFLDTPIDTNLFLSDCLILQNSTWTIFVQI